MGTGNLGSSCSGVSWLCLCSLFCTSNNCGLVLGVVVVWFGLLAGGLGKLKLTMGG